MNGTAGQLRTSPALCASIMWRDEGFQERPCDVMGGRSFPVFWQAEANAAL
jgi:hypothetical protein